MQEFQGKVAVVTGAGSGIGRALAIRFAAEGMDVGLADLEADTLNETVALIADATPDAVVSAHEVDVSDGAAVDGWADAVFAAHGQVDVLCNNAGVFVGGFLWDRPPADLEFVLGVNLWGILHGIRAFVPRMIAQDTHGHIVNTSSIAGMLGSPYAGPYSISKFAAFAATESLAGDLIASGSKLQASVLCPGIVTTNIATDSERHRPAELRTEPTDDQLFVNDVLLDTMSRGIDPSIVAGLVVDAIVAERFVVLTHEQHATDIEARGRALAERRIPDLADFA